MSKSKHQVSHDMATLAEDARALWAATSEVAGEKVAEARERLKSALDRGKELYGGVQDKVVASAKAGDQLVRDNPYAALGIAVGVGALLGYLVGRRHGSCQDDD